MILAVILSSCSKTEITQEINVEPSPPDPFPIELNATLGDFNINGEVANSELSFSVKTNETTDVFNNGNINVVAIYKLYDTTNNSANEKVSKLLLDENIGMGNSKEMRVDVSLIGNGTYIVRIEAQIADSYGVNENFSVSFYGNDIKVVPQGSLMRP